MNAIRISHFSKSSLCLTAFARTLVSRICSGVYSDRNHRMLQRR